MPSFHPLASRQSGRRSGLALVLAAVAVVVTSGACNEGREGDRCNPLLSHDECGGTTLVCSGPSTGYPLPGICVENYCCPKDPTTSSNPECNGTDSFCVADAGPDAGADSGAD